MTSRAFGLALPFAAAVLALFACTKTETRYVDEPDEEEAETDAGPAPVSADSGLGVLSFKPDTMFSGFDGTHTFQVPFAVYDAADDLVVTADDPSAIEVTPKKLVTATTNGGTDNGKYFIVTVKKAGTIGLLAKSGKSTATATINVTTYAPDRWTVGETRYTTGTGAENPPCTDCHVNGAAIDHSPAALATATDEKIGVVITTGVSTHGFPIKINGKIGHSWQVSEDERSGLVTYLRGLEPKGFK